MLFICLIVGPIQINLKETKKQIDTTSVWTVQCAICTALYISLQKFRLSTSLTANCDEPVKETKDGIHRKCVTIPNRTFADWMEFGQQATNIKWKSCRRTATIGTTYIQYIYVSCIFSVVRYLNRPSSLQCNVWVTFGQTHKHTHTHARSREYVMNMKKKNRNSFMSKKMVEKASGNRCFNRYESLKDLV